MQHQLFGVNIFGVHKRLFHCHYMSFKAPTAPFPPHCVFCLSFPTASRGRAQRPPRSLLFPEPPPTPPPFPPPPQPTFTPSVVSSSSLLLLLLQPRVSSKLARRRSLVAERLILYRSFVAHLRGGRRKGEAAREREQDTAAAATGKMHS